MAGAGRIRAGEDLPVQGALRQLLQRELQHLQVVLRVVRAGVPGPQDPGQHLPSAGREQRVEAEPALVVPGRQLLLGMNTDRGRVEIKDHPARGRPGLPRPLASQRACLANPLDLRAPDREQHPSGRRHRRDIPEQRGLPLKHREIRDAASTIGCHHRQITEHPPRIMSRATLTGPSQHAAQPVAQPEALRRERQQRAPRARGQASAVRDHIYRSERRTSGRVGDEPPCLARARWSARPRPPNRTCPFPSIRLSTGHALAALVSV